MQNETQVKNSLFPGWEWKCIETIQFVQTTGFHSEFMQRIFEIVASAKICD